MAYRVQASFAAGELDPALHERTTLEKHASGLATARNVVIGKTGRVISRMPRKFFKKTKNDDQRSILYSPPSSGYLLEWGPLYVRVYSIDAALTGYPEGSLVGSGFPGFTGEYTHALTEADLNSIHFESSKKYVYIFCAGKAPLKFDPTGNTSGAFISFGFSPVDIFNVLIAAPIATGVTPITSTATGYNVDYAITIFQNGQESGPLYYEQATYATSKIPLTAAEFTRVDVNSGVSAISGVTEIRVYRRPANGGAYGFIGSSSATAGFVGANVVYRFLDLGQAADYTHSLPTTVITPSLSSAFFPNTGAIYQQRLLVANYAGLGTYESGKESINASRTGYQGNFTRDYPLSDDSSLVFKAGSSGQARVLRMIDNDGLIVFTAVGVFLHSGALATNNLALDKKGNWVIDDRIPPIGIPGGVLFMDKTTNTVRVLSYSTENASYAGEELSVFSNHLFSGKQVTSWGFHEGELPCLIATFEDGTFASLTYERDHQMRAWTRHDSTNLKVEYVCGSRLANKTFFIVEKAGKRYIEQTLPRYVPTSVSAVDKEADKNESNAFMDSIVSYNGLLNGSLVGADVFLLAQIAAGGWGGSLTLTCGTSGLFPTPGVGAIGNVLRYFDPSDGRSIDLTVTARASNNSITVLPSSAFPAANVSGFRLYNTTTTVTGLTHLNGENAAVMIDGWIAASPKNNIENYAAVLVAAGSATLPNGFRGAIVHVGRPITADVQTLDIDSVEQRPVFIESKTNNKIYVKVHKSRGLYAAYEFPALDSVAGMEDLDRIDVNYANDGVEELVSNRYIAPQTKRFEVTLSGNWDTNGRVALRQVDPVHFEILSIIPDIQDLRR